MAEPTPEQPALRHSPGGISLGGSSQLLILTGALLLIVLFFSVAIGLKKASDARKDNEKTVAALFFRSASVKSVPERGRLFVPWKVVHQTLQPFSDASIEAPNGKNWLSPADEGVKGALNFASQDNRETMARQTAIVGIAALGMTLVIILGGIDLAVGSIIALASVVVATMLAGAVPEGEEVYSAHVGPWWVLVCAGGGILAGVACGVITGVLVTKLRMMPFIVTLGMLGAVRGAAKGFGDNQKVDAPEETWLQHLLSSGDHDVFHDIWPTGVQAFSQFSWIVAALSIVVGAALIIFRLFKGRRTLSVPTLIIGSVLTIAIVAMLGWLWFGMRYWAIGIWMMLWLAVAVAIMLRYTRLGRHIFAIGSNEQTARLCGVATDKVKLIVYSLCGLFAGVAGVMQFARLGVGDPTVAVGKELDVIAAVVIGGGSLSGGEGSIAGSLIGALIMTVIRVGCTQLGLPNWVQEIVTGAIIVAAVALDRLRHRQRA